jgi:hypothetical protein
MSQRRWGAVVVAVVAALALGAPPGRAAPVKGRGNFIGYSDERGGFRCRTAAFQVIGTLSFGQHTYNGRYDMTFTGCPDGVHSGPAVLYVSGTDAAGRRLTAQCGVYTHDCTGNIRPRGAPPQPNKAFHMNYSYTSPAAVGRLYLITGTYTQT